MLEFVRSNFIDQLVNLVKGSVIMKRMGAVVLILALVLGTVSLSVPPAKATIFSFTAIPQSPVKLGQIVALYGKGDNGTSRFTINGEPRAEIGSPENRENWKTGEFGVGNYHLCFVLRHEGGWENAEQTCLDYVVTEPDPTGNVSAGANFQGYCESLGLPRFSGEPQNPYTGVCAGGDREVHLTEAEMWKLCAWQDGGVRPYPGLSDSHNLYAWTCNSQSTYIAPPPADESGGGSGTGSGSGSGSGGGLPAVSQARQAGTPGGVDVIVYCMAKNYPQAHNVDNTANGWECYGNGTLRLDWNQVCRDVYGDNYHAENPRNMTNEWRCVEGGGSSGGGQGSGGTTVGCPSAGPSVSIGWTAQIADADPKPLKLFSEASVYAAVIIEIPIRETVMVIGGPACSAGYRLWQVSYQGYQGWIAEVGKRGLYNIMNQREPSGGAQTGTSSCSPQFQVGDHARVTPGAENRLRSGPSLSSSKIGVIPPGGEFTVVGGPTCADGYLWWQVNYQGQVGWTAQGDASGLWIEWVGSGNPQQRDPDPIALVSVNFAPFNHQYLFKVNTVTCKIENGADVVADEIGRFGEWSKSIPQLPNPDFLTRIQDYFQVNNGQLEQLRHQMELEVRNQTGCEFPIYQVGSFNPNYFDPSGLGNIVFGFFAERYPFVLESVIARWKQSQNEETPNQWWDNPDDITQRDTGRAIAKKVRQGYLLDAALVEQMAKENDLY